MKFIVTLLLVVTIGSSCFAQLSPGSTAPNWIHTDINGNTWDLYTLTAQGKTVILHMAVTWCTPDYGYHMSQNLINLYNQYGPAGTISPGEIMVFLIESDPNTTLADLNGTGSNTQGDWVTGTPFPIIDLGAASNSFNTAYSVTYWPMIYKICPDNKIYEIGHPTTQQAISEIGNCSFATDINPVSVFTPLMCDTSFAPTFLLHNNGSNTITSCDATYSYDGGPSNIFNWTGSLTSGQSSLVTLPVMTFGSGSHTMQVITSNPNGGNDNNNTNNLGSFVFNLQTVVGVAVPYNNTITATPFPYPNWIVNDPQGPVSWSRNITNASMYLRYYGDPASGTTDEVIIEPIDLSTMSVASLQFDVAYRQYSTLNPDSLEVLISSDCGITWNSEWVKWGVSLSTVPGALTTEFFPGAGQWRSECIDLTSYAGASKVFIMFRGYGWSGNNIYVDNINVSNSMCPTAIFEADPEVQHVRLSPNPASESTYVSFDIGSEENASLNIYNVFGELIYSRCLGEIKGEQFVLVHTDTFSSGMYLVELTAGTSRTVSQLIIGH